MGSGSFGGGGGGGGGHGGGSGGGGEYRSKNGKMVATAVTRAAMAQHVRAVLAPIPCDYLMKYVASPFARNVYEELFLIHVDLVQNKKWAGIRQRLGVASGSGCFLALARALIKKFAAAEKDERVRETISLGLEDFFVRVVGEDPDLFLSGTDTEVIAAVDPQAFATTAGHFMTFLIWRMLEREHERLPRQGETELRSVAEMLSNRVWARFARDYRDKPFADRTQVTPRDLMYVLSSTEWFCKELKS